MNGDLSCDDEMNPSNKNNDTFCKFQDYLNVSIRSLKQNSSVERDYAKYNRLINLKYK